MPRWLVPTTDSLIHVGVALVVSAVIGWYSVQLAWVVPVLWFHGREMAHAEAWALRNNDPHDIIRRWWLRPWTLHWHNASRREFYHPTLAAVLVALIFWYFHT